MKQNSTTWFTFLAAWRVVTILTSPWSQCCYPQAPARENWIRATVLATNAIRILGRKENSPFAHFLSIFSVFFEYQIDSFLQDGNIGKLKQFTRNNASWNASLVNIIGHNGCKSCVEHETKVNELSYLFVFNSLITHSFLYNCYAFWERCVPCALAFEAEFVVERVGQEICNEKYYVKVCWNVLPISDLISSIENTNTLELQPSAHVLKIMSRVLGYERYIWHRTENLDNGKLNWIIMSRRTVKLSKTYRCKSDKEKLIHVHRKVR